MVKCKLIMVEGMTLNFLTKSYEFPGAFIVHVLVLVLVTLIGQSWGLLIGGIFMELRLAQAVTTVVSFELRVPSMLLRDYIILLLSERRVIFQVVCLVFWHVCRNAKMQTVKAWHLIFLTASWNYTCQITCPGQTFWGMMPALLFTINKQATEFDLSQQRDT